MLEFKRYGLFWIGALSCALVAACGVTEHRGGREAAEVADSAGKETGKDLAAKAQTELAGQPTEAALSRMGAMMQAIDTGEVAQAEAELARGTDPGATGFAMRMRDEHSVHDERVDDLLERHKAAPLEGKVSAALRDDAAAGVAELERTAPREVDFVYLEMQVRMHAAGEELLNELVNLAPADAEIRGFLVGTRDQIASHRTAAMELLRAR